MKAWKESKAWKAWQHYKTITKHRTLVTLGCFRLGLIWQGLIHDFSKYSWTEFSVGIKYYQGDRSPNNAEREDRGSSQAWLHHKGRNKHHFEYWLDYSEQSADVVRGMKMPRKYVAEMICDRLAACKVYQKEAYTPESPLKYYLRGKGQFFMNPKTREELEMILEMIGKEGEEKTFEYIKNVYLKGLDI